MASTGAAGLQVPQRSAHRSAIFTLALIFLALRAFDLGVFAWLARRDGVGLRETLLSWDGEWLNRAAMTGWPSDFALDGPPTSSTWAWPPLAPLLARAVAAPLGLADTGAALIGINVVAGFVASILLYFLVVGPLGTVRAITVAAIWQALPASPVLVMGYAEGLLFALGFGSLLALSRHRYLVAGLLLLPAGLTKLQVVPFAATVMIVVVVDRIKRGRQRVSIGALAGSILLAGLSMVAWPAIVAINLGSVSAYAKVLLPWERHLIPFYDTLAWFAWTFSAPSRALLFAVGVLIVSLIAAVVVWSDRRQPFAIRVNSVVMPVFFLAVGAGLSTARYLFAHPAVPIALERLARGPVRLAALGVVLLGSQAAWIILYVGGGAGAMPP